MTRQTEFRSASKFSDWLREQTALDSRRIKLDIHNLDFILHRYDNPKLHKVMLLEEKTRKGHQGFAQHDTHQLIHNALMIANGRQVRSGKGKLATLHYYGYHLLRFENESPLDGKMMWDDRLITKEQLIKYLRFDFAPLPPLEIEIPSAMTEAVAELNW